MASDVRNAFADYTDSYGLVQNKKPTSTGWTSGNGLLYTAEAIIVLKQNGALTETLKEQYRNAIKSCQLIPGLYRRHPELNDQEAIDDYTGIATASVLIDDKLSDKILNYGRSTRFLYGPFKLPYYYENEDPYNQRDINAWFGRYFGLISHLKLTSTEGSGFFTKALWTLSIATSGLFNKTNTETDSYTLPWVMVNGADQKSVFTKVAKWFLMRRVKARYGSMKALFAEYFNDPEHPISKYCRD